MLRPLPSPPPSVHMVTKGCQNNQLLFENQIETNPLRTDASLVVVVVVAVVIVVDDDEV